MSLALARGAAQQPQRILTVRQQDVEVEIPVQQDLWSTADSVRVAFSSRVAETINGLTPIELLSQFINFTLRFETHDPGVSVLSLTRVLFLHMRQEYLKDNDLHAITRELGLEEDRQAALLSTYYEAQCALKNASLLFNEECVAAKSALFNAGKRKKASILALFGGQGNVDDYFSELARLYNTYGLLLQPFMDRMIDALRRQVESPEARAAGFYSKGFDVMRWLSQSELRPPLQYLVSAPISMPLIGLTQLLNYWVMLKVMQKTAAEARASIKGATGHSQGLISAVAVSSANDDDDLMENSERAIVLLFWMGLRCQQAYPPTTLNPKVLQDSLANGEGDPTPMLAINNLPHSVVRDHVEATNQHLSAERQIRIALLNGPRSVIVSGAPQSLYGLNVSLRKLKARSGADQSRVPHSKRDVRFSTRYLPVSVPFHSSYLESVPAAIEHDLERLSILFRGEDLQMSVFATDDGRDMRTDAAKLKPLQLTLNIVEQICCKPVLWEKATACESTHMLDFGPGGSSGIGALTSRNKDGTGVQVILAGALSSLARSLLDKSYLFNADESSVRYAQNWAQEFAPRLVRTAHDNRIIVDTAWTRLIGKPPLMVAGMTPSSVHEDFVAATINAGYHGELAGGGIYSENALREKVSRIMKLIDPGESVTINVLFLNARQWGFQYPLVQTMRKEGFPLDGFCVAAGVPSLDNANEIIRNLAEAGIKHVAFKPGSGDSIRQVISIAEANPTVPIIMQWTGGRAGGHHSYEDFHQPILETYGAIRKQRNIILVAGSGFGDAQGTLPYLTGEWSVNRDYPPMPFDAVLFASRMMVAKEGRASAGSKALIVAAPGVKDELKWEDSYVKPAGGVVTVKSELGEPIHKIATRGVLLWKELDETVFGLPKDKRRAVLAEKKSYIIKRLNADSQKVWFGAKLDGTPCDLEDMTYNEVALRLVRLCWVEHQKRWIDKSYRMLVADFLWRVEERFSRETKNAFLQSVDQFRDDPTGFVKTFFVNYPAACTQLLTTEDVLHFLSLCGRRGQKPVPFVPILDDNFETWFKKDSLWQSEDLDAVVDQDPQRVCILQGPVAVAYSTVADEPIKHILDGIHEQHVQALLQRYYGNDVNKVPVVPYLAGSVEAPASSDQNLPKGVTLVKSLTSRWCRAFDVSSKDAELPDIDAWLNLLASPRLNWLNALLKTKSVVRGKMLVDSPLRQLFKPRPGQRAVINLQSDGKDGEKPISLAIFDSKLIRGARANEKSGSESPAIEVTFAENTNIITVHLFERKGDTVIALPLLFAFRPQQGYAPIHEIMEGRNHRIKTFYWRLWFDEDFEASGLADPSVPLETEFRCSSQITRKDITEFCRTVGNQAELYVDWGQKKLKAPMDFAIVAGWRAVIKGIFPAFIDGDLLKLVHLSNSFRMLNNGSLLEEGDVVDCRASINSIVNGETGKTVEVKGVIARDGVDVVEVTSQFFYRGKFETDFQFTFKKTEELPIQVTLKSTKDVAVLKSKQWIQLEDTNLARSLVVPGAVLTFRLHSIERLKNSTVFSSLETKGSITVETPTKEVIQIGHVDFECGECYGNPVTAYLARVGVPVEQVAPFPGERPSIVPDPSVSASAFTTPTSNETYAAVSGDLNPIHVNSYFADLANLPATITHGMWTSAATRRLIEVFAADNQPQRVTAYSANFLAMVLPGDQLQAKLFHVGMRNGKKIIRLETVNQNNEKVLEGSAEVDQPVTAYVFTGQGSQEKGMGMDLYASSPVARSIWDRADAHFVRSYGFSILDIVRNNPKEVTVHFGGPKGARIRESYRAMTYDVSRADGSGTDTLPLFPSISDSTESFTFRQPNGLLNATQFTQPALTLLQKAAFEDMLAKGLIQQNCPFAGHSLGEYAALASIGNVLPIEALVDVVFYRGMTMQSAVPRDATGHSDYAMCAVNPSRVGPTFGETPLKFVVDVIQRLSGQLLEIVNYNVENWQYVVSGHFVNLETLTSVLNDLRARKVDFAKLTASTPLAEVKRQLEVIITAQRDAVLERKAELELSGQVFELSRGEATIPLVGIDVPFHSRFLLSGVAPFRAYLSQRINPVNVDVSLLVGKYIPNLVAQPFRLDREYVKMVQETCNSPRLAKILRRWPANAEEATTMRAAESKDTTSRPIPPTEVFDDSDPSVFEPITPAQQQQLGYTLLVELLAYQFASPVRWIETQDRLFKDFLVERLVEIGPGPTLANMATRTLKFKYEAYDEAMTFRRELLCYTRDKALIYYEDSGVSASTSEAPASAPVVAAKPTVAAPPPPPAPVATALVGAVTDAPISAKEILHVLVAQKLKKSLNEVPLNKSIKELSGGKSTLQNELLGDLQKEFGEVAVEKAEDMPLGELAQALQNQGGIKGGAPLGKVTAGLVAKLLGSKMPGGYGPGQVRAYLAGDFGLGSQRVEGVLLHSLTIEPASRLAAEADARAWLDTAVASYSSYTGVAISKGSVGPAPAAATASVSVSGPVSVPDAPVNALQFLRVLVAAKMKKRVADVPPATTLKAISAGKSTLQNELLGDIQKEFGGDGGLGDNAAEQSLADLASSPSGSAYARLGSVSQAQVSRIISSKMPGGFSAAAVRGHLASRWGLGSGHQDGALLHALTMEPPSRLGSEAEALAWLDSVVSDYATTNSVPLGSSSGSSAGGAVSGGNTVVDSAAITRLQLRQDAFVREQMELYAAYVGHDLLEGHRLFEKTVQERDTLQREIDLWRGEHGEIYAEGIKPQFDARKARRYDSYWNWSRQEAMSLYYDIVFGRLTNTNIDRSILQRCIDLMNRADAALISLFDFYMNDSKKITDRGIPRHPSVPITNYTMAHQLGTTLAENCREALAESPHFKDVSVPSAPSTEVSADGQIIYREVPRPGVRKLESYVREMRRGGAVSLVASPTQDHLTAARKAMRKLQRLLLSRASDKRLQLRVRNLLADITRTVEAGRVVTPPIHEAIAVGAVVPRSTSTGANGSNTSNNGSNGSNNGNGKPVNGNGNGVGVGDRVPFLYLKTEAPGQPSGWTFDRTTTNIYMDALNQMATEGLTFTGKTALLTGCGKGSIGAEVLRGLLAGGANVIVTTSSFSLKTTEYYRDVYERSGARGSALVVVPFNQASLEDTRAVVDYIYDNRTGLGWDLDIVIPFAALSETGREISEIDSKSELAHRLMLTNLLRLLGAIKTQKEARGFDTRPAQVLLPLSPNHGVFGGDGLYGESKAGLETLFNRWHSENWGSYLTVVGAVIGWTRGTGLMAGNNVVAEGLEKMGVRTFSTQEMAFNLLGLVHPDIVRLAQYSPVWADLNGGLDHIPKLNPILRSLRESVTETANIRQVIAKENDLDEAVLRGPVRHALKSITPRANIKFPFPELKTYSQLQAIVDPHLREVLDLSRVIVVTGFGEVGPWGNSRTRWEMEAFGDFSLEGCVELAWVMGLIKHHNGQLKGQHYAGWVDAETKEPVKDSDIKVRYEKRILEHTGIRLIESELFEGYDPNKKTFLQQVAIDHDLAPVEVSKEEAEHFRLLHGDKVEVYEKVFGSGQWLVRLKRGATLYIPKALRFDRLVAGQVPTGWDAKRYGLPEDIVRQVDPITLYVLVSTAEALLAAGITDPYEFYKYVHVSEVGNTSGGGVGGMRANIRIYKDRLLDKPVQSDILQENFINTMPAWVNMLLLSSSGPIKTPVGACATAVESVDIGVETILSGKAKIVIVGGYDDFQEEGSYEFASMRATSNTLEEFAKGREPKEMSRPATTSRAGFMEAQGAGMQILMPASLAIEMGVPIYGVIAHTATATDKEGRSVPAPGQGILTTARETHPNGVYPVPSLSRPVSPPLLPAQPATERKSVIQTPSLLDVKYRTRQMRIQRKRIAEWVAAEQRFLAEELELIKTDGQTDDNGLSDFMQRRLSEINREATRQETAALGLWGNEFYRQDPRISPLRGALAVFGLSIDDIGVASFHGTGTQANDINESEVLHMQMIHLGRTRGNPLPAIMQKYLTGHPKGAAAAWMLNGVLQSLDTGLVPGNRNADNIEAKLRAFDYIYYPSRAIQTDGIRAGLLKSFGFGQVGGEVLVVHPDYVLGCLDEDQFHRYTERRALRQDAAYRHLHDALTDVAPFARVKTTPPYTDAAQSKVYLNPLARAHRDIKTGNWIISGDSNNDKASPATPAPNVDEQAALTQAIASLSVSHETSSVGSLSNNGIGIDIELLSAIDINNETFISRNFTPSEIAYCRAAPDPRASFTGRWCAKEAAIKAVSSHAPQVQQLWKGGAGASLIDIEVVPVPNGAPTLLFHNDAQQVVAKAGVSNVTVSISHSGAYAIAMATAS